MVVKIWFCFTEKGVLNQSKIGEYPYNFNIYKFLTHKYFLYLINM